MASGIYLLQDGEVIESEFNQSYLIEAYVDNFDGYGDNTVLYQNLKFNKYLKLN